MIDDALNIVGIAVVGKTDRTRATSGRDARHGRSRDIDDMEPARTGIAAHDIGKAAIFIYGNVVGVAEGAVLNIVALAIGNGKIGRVSV